MIKKNQSCKDLGGDIAGRHRNEFHSPDVRKSLKCGAEEEGSVAGREGECRGGSKGH